MANAIVNNSVLKNGLTIGDLTSKYKQTIDNYNLMVSLMSDEQKKIFNIAINLYDIQLRQDRWNSYIGYALKALAMCGWYYDISQTKWMPCHTSETFVNDDAQMTDEDAYNRYLGSLYPRQMCRLLGISFYDITRNNIDKNSLNLATAGEMSYEPYDLEFNLQYETGGEQKNKTAKTGQFEHPDIPISSNVDLSQLTKGDNSQDKFIYAYTDSGISKNKRDWRPMIMDRIAQQVMEQCPPGNMGHVKPKDVGYELPLPVITWIGAMTELLADGTKRLWLKGYIIPTQDGINLKTYIRAKAINSISVYGGLTLLPNPDGTQSVLDIELKSIDISGKLKEGLNSAITGLSGEMSDYFQHQMQQYFDQKHVNEREVEKMAVDVSNITLSEIKSMNPKLYGEMKSAIISDMKADENQKIIMTKAGEMDTLISQIGGSPFELFEQYKNFAGEMAEIVGLTPQNNLQIPDIKEVTTKIKEIITDFKNLNSIVKPDQGQTIGEKIKALVQQNQLAQNTKAVQDVNNKFEELVKGITNDAIKNLVAMQFNGILQAKPESLPDDYLQTSIKTLEDQVPNAIKTVLENAQSIMQSGQQAGEMAIFDNLGTGSGIGGKKPSQMTDEELAQSLGYSFT